MDFDHIRFKNFNKIQNKYILCYPKINIGRSKYIIEIITYIDFFMNLAYEIIN